MIDEVFKNPSHLNFTNGISWFWLPSNERGQFLTKKEHVNCNHFWIKDKKPGEDQLG